MRKILSTPFHYLLSLALFLVIAPSALATNLDCPTESNAINCCHIVSGVGCADGTAYLMGGKCTASATIATWPSCTSPMVLNCAYNGSDASIPECICGAAGFEQTNWGCIAVCSDSSKPIHCPSDGTCKARLYGPGGQTDPSQAGSCAKQGKGVADYCSGSCTSCSAGYVNYNGACVKDSALVYDSGTSSFFGENPIGNSWTDMTGVWTKNADGSIYNNNIDGSGNPGFVGIGTQAPARLLDVGDAMRFEPSSLPSSPEAGDALVYSGNNNLEVYDGAKWKNAGLWDDATVVITPTTYTYTLDPSSPVGVLPEPHMRACPCKSPNSTIAKDCATPSSTLPDNVAGLVCFDQYRTGIFGNYVTHYNLFNKTTNTGTYSTNVTATQTSLRVGIGTDTPANRLDVKGAVAIGGNYGGTSTAPTNGLIVQGPVGIATTTVTSNALSFGPTGSYSPRVISVERNPWSDNQVSGLKIIAGSPMAGDTDNDGGTLTLSSGISTGRGHSKINFETYNGAGSSGTADNPAIVPMVVNGYGGTVAIGTDLTGYNFVYNPLSVGAGGASIGKNYSAAHIAPGSGLIMEGRLGIGTYNPAQMLDVNGQIHANNIVQVDGSGLFYNANKAATQYLLNSAGANWGTIQNDTTGSWSLGYKANSDTSLGTDVLSWTSGGKVGVGTTAPAGQFSVTGTSANTHGDPCSWAGMVWFDENANGTVDNGECRNAFVVEASGNVRIGVDYIDQNDDTWTRLRDGDNGSYRDLAVGQFNSDGDTYLAQTNFKNVYIGPDRNTYIHGSANSLNLQFGASDYADFSPSLSVIHTDELSVWAPTNGLSVVGPIDATNYDITAKNIYGKAFRAYAGAPSCGPSDTGYSFNGDGCYDTGMFSAGDGIIDFYANNVVSMYILNNKIVSNVSTSGFSDRRLKEDIKPFTDGLQTLEKINPVSYKFNGLADTVKGQEGIGVIAQDVKDAMPYSVDTFSKKLNPTDDKDTDVYLYNPAPLPFILVNSIKEQQKIIENQQKQIDELKSEMEVLKAHDQ